MVPAVAAPRAALARSRRSSRVNVASGGGHVTAREWRDEVLEAVSTRFESRLTHEVSTLRVEVTRELSDMRAEIIRWSFVFWITQLGAMAGLLAYVK